MAPPKDIQSAICRSEPAPGIVLLTFDMPGTSANVLTQAMFDELASHFDQLESEQASIRGLILFSAKSRIFFAGADLKLIWESLDWPADDIRAFCRQGQRVFARLGTFPFPSVAAIHGICVGGGLELTLACDFRICSDARNTLLGLPEVNLGLIPGWCGTARTPRLIGLAEGIELVVSGRLMNSDEADAFLLVDDVVPQNELIPVAMELIDRCDRKRLRSRRSMMNSPIIASQIKHNSLDDWVRKIESNRAIHPFAPLTVAEHMIRSASMNLAEAGESEGIAMSEVWGSDSSRGLLNMFFVDEWIKKNPTLQRQENDQSKEMTGIPIRTLGVVGAGQMGRQLAQALTALNCEMLIYDARPETTRVLVDQLVDQNVSAEMVAELSGLASCDFVIESIVENLQIKRDVLSRIEKELAPHAIIASNTSTIPILDLAKALERPQQLIGFHVCHPVEQRRLCEVIPSSATHRSTLVTAVNIAKSIGKTPIIVGDAPGFVVNRLLAPMLDQAVNLVTAGIPPESVEDAAMRFGFEAGPLEVIDSIGVDTLFYAGIIFAERRPHLVGRSKVLPHLIKAGRLGQKSGSGFFSYATGRATSDAQLRDVLRNAIDGPSKLSLNSKQIQFNLLLPMVVEAIAILEEGIVRDVREIDFCAVHGAGFPAHQGGPLFWADRFTAVELVQQIESVAQLRQTLVVPARLRERIEHGGKLYG